MATKEHWSVNPAPHDFEAAADYLTFSLTSPLSVGWCAGSARCSGDAMQTQVIRCREFALTRLEEVFAGSDESGQGMVEYALILVLIAVVVIVILTTVGHRVNNVFSNISHGLST